MDLSKIRNRVYDYGLALYIVAVIVMLISPLPDWVLDILLAFDMSL
jgi:flagellar biosynthesis protein FlhA